MARMSYDLATIRCNAPLDFDPEQNLRKEVDNNRLYQLFLELEFAKLIDKYHLTAPQGEGAPQEGKMVEGTCTSEVVQDAARAQEFLELWRQADHVAVLALPGLDAVCVSFNPSPTEGHAALLFANRLENYNQVLQALFAADIQKVVHGAKELEKELMDQGIEPQGIRFDTELAAYLLSPTDGSYDLEKLGITYYNQEFAKAKEYLAPGAFDSLFSLESEGQSAGPMGAFLSHCALIDCLYETLSQRLEELGLTKLYEEIELPLCPVLAEMERSGVLVDRKALVAFGEALAQGIEKDQALIYELAGEEFNINSTQQLGKILFDKLGLPPVKKTKTGYSTNAEVLEKLRGKHPIIEAILDYRQLTKLKSTYADGLGKVIAPDGRIHTCFQNTVTATGRLSSTEPNLQNIPVRTELGAELRKMFVAPAGWVLVDADYSQIELRLLAHIAGDEAMIAAFRSGEDFHTVTAARVFGVAPGEVTHEMRRRAKAVNFGIVYGISDFSLSQDLGVTRAEARAYMEKYFETYSGVRAYMSGVVEQARKDGYVSTLMGRRRWLPELKSSNFNLRSFGERVALNMPIQGTAADIIKLAMIRVRDRLRAEGLAARLVLQVHDELIVECPEEEAAAVKRLLTEEMESAAALAVPLTAEAHAGRSWAEAKE